MITEKIVNKFGYTKDTDNSWFKKVFKNNTKLKEVHIDIYPEHPLVASSAPFMLLTRTIEKNVTISNSDSRLILMKNDIYKTHIMNISYEKVIECCYKKFDNCFEFILNIQNIYIRVTVSN